MRIEHYKNYESKIMPAIRMAVSKNWHKEILLGLMTLSTLVASAQGLAPVHQEMDCGEMLYRKPATYIVEFKNTSNEPVEIKSVDTGCGCTLAKYTQGLLEPNAIAKISLTFDCKQLGHFTRNIRVFSNSVRMTEIKPDSAVYHDMYVSGIVVAKKMDYSGQYPFKMGSLLTDRDNLEFDDVNEGQRLVQEIHIMNPMSQNTQPVLLRLPPYLTADMSPVILGPKQKGVIKVTLNSSLLHDFGLNQTTVYLGKNSADKATPEKMLTVSSVLLPPAVAQDDVNRPYAAKMSLSKDYIDMTPLRQKSKNKDVITITNTGHNPLEIQKLQLFTTGLQLTLNKQTIESGEEAILEVTCKAKDLKKLRVRPRILMITNDPGQQKVIIEVRN